MELITKSISFVNNYKKYFLLVPALLILFFIPFFKILSICIALIFLGAFSLSYQRYIKYCGIELVFFSTVISSLLFGSLFGLIVGVLSYLIGQYMVGQITPYSLITILGIAITSTLAPILFAYEFSIISLSIIVRLVSLSIISFGWALLGFNLKDTIITGVINVIFNLIVFTSFGNTIYRILS